MGSIVVESNAAPPSYICDVGLPPKTLGMESMMRTVVVLRFLEHQKKKECLVHPHSGSPEEIQVVELMHNMCIHVYVTKYKCLEIFNLHLCTT